MHLEEAQVSYLFTRCLLAVCALEHSGGRLGEESIWVCAPGDRDDVRYLLLALLVSYTASLYFESFIFKNGLGPVRCLSG